MTIAEAHARFETLLSQRENSDSVEVLVSSMLNFYRDERAEDCRIEDDGDMLLYQWGTYDWGEGRWFDLNITRQFIPAGGEDDGIFQLSVTAKYSPTADSDDLGSGNRWCASPTELPRFSEFVSSSAAMTHLAGKACSRVDLTFNQTG